MKLETHLDVRLGRSDSHERRLVVVVERTLLAEHLAYDGGGRPVRLLHLGPLALLNQQALSPGPTLSSLAVPKHNNPELNDLPLLPVFRQLVVKPAELLVRRQHAPVAVAVDVRQPEGGRHERGRAPEREDFGREGGVGWAGGREAEAAGELGQAAEGGRGGEREVEGQRGGLVARAPAGERRGGLGQTFWSGEVILKDDMAVS